MPQQNLSLDLQPIEHNQLANLAEVFVQVFNYAPWHENWQVKAVLVRLTEIFHTPGFYGLMAFRDSQITGFVMGYVEQWDRQKHFYL